MPTGNRPKARRHRGRRTPAHSATVEAVARSVAGDGITPDRRVSRDSGPVGAKPLDRDVQTSVQLGMRRVTEHGAGLIDGRSKSRLGVPRSTVPDFDSGAALCLVDDLLGEGA